MLERLVCGSWLVEALPRVALLLAAEPQLFPRALPSASRGRAANGHTNQSAVLLVSCKTRLVKETLALLGVDVHRSVLCWKLGHTYRTTASLLWPAASPCGGARQPALRALRRVVLPPALRPARFATEVYASGRVLLHERTSTRRLTNHAELLRALSERRLPRPAAETAANGGDGAGTALARAQASGISGKERTLAPFLTVLSGNGSTPLRAQIELFRSARCQIGPHGAGMALMLFAPAPWFGTAEVSPGSYFVSLRGRPGEHLNRHRNRTSKWVINPKPNACYRGLAATMGQRHEWVLIGGAPANEDLTPDVDAVVEMAFRMCTPPSSLDRETTEAASQVGAG